MLRLMRFIAGWRRPCRWDVAGSETKGVKSSRSGGGSRGNTRTDEMRGGALYHVDSGSAGWGSRDERGADSSSENRESENGAPHVGLGIEIVDL